MSDYPSSCPKYTLSRLGPLFKIVKFKNCLVDLDHVHSRSEPVHCDVKMDNSLSRSRRLILEKALCNPWDWFCTFTIDPKKYARDDLKQFHKDFTQFIRDKRKCGLCIKYLLVPELHSDLVSWHMHGFLFGDVPVVSFRKMALEGALLPDKLLKGDFYTWPDYMQKFGFCSLGRIKSPVRSAFYISKYISKDNSRLVSSLGSNLFYCSQGLNTAVKHLEILGHTPELDRFLEKDYDFCSVGMSKVSDHLDWTFGLDLGDIIPMLELLPDEDLPSSGNFFDDMAAISWEQLCFENSSDQRV